MRTVFYYSVCSISQVDQRCLINEENKQVCVGSTSHGNLQEKRDLCGVTGEGNCVVMRKRVTRWLWILYPRAQTLGAHLGLLQVPTSARQPGLFSCSSHLRQKLLPEPTSALLLLCFPSATVPFLLSLHFCFHFLI